MSKKENWIDSFRTQSRENVYVLTVSVVVKEKEIVSVREIVDGLKGDVGVCYANNLLCRLANEHIKGTDFEKILWREYRTMKPETDKDFAYIKTKDQQNHVVAGMKWYQQLPEDYD